jgi:NTF2 fold immunity protein
MKPVILGATLLAAFALTAVGSHSQNTTEVRVPDGATALKIAEPALIKTYGKRQIDDERPLTAKLDSGTWTVYGTLCCPDRNGHRTCEEGKCLGGVAVLKLRQTDGKILSIIHYK